MRRFPQRHVSRPAFVALLCGAAASAEAQAPAPAAAAVRPALEPQQDAPRQKGYSSRVAIALGAIVPGSGHLYAGEWRKSYPLFLASAGSIYAGVAIYELDRCTFSMDPHCESGSALRYRTAGTLMALAGGAVWVWSARDAGRAVERRRARHALQVRPSLYWATRAGWHEGSANPSWGVNANIAW